METTLFAVINVETPVNVEYSNTVSECELVILDDAKLRQVGGGLCVEVNF
jgi:hypothetical protein